MKRKTLFYLILFSFMLIFAEFAFRSFYAVSYKNASILLKPFHVIDRYYNGFTEEIDFEKDDHADYDILMLGGSVLTDQWGSIAPELDSYLEEQGLNVRIHNLAMPAHTSLDSRLKYENVAKNGYDLVLLYHGINETRFNNCPPEMFKDDYTHVDFYAKVYNLMHNSFSRYSITPLMIQQFQTNLFDIHDHK